VITALPCMWSIRNVTTYPTIPRDTQNLNRIQHQNASVQAEPHAPVTVLRYETPPQLSLQINNTCGDIHLYLVYL
jgi:hypothetical protein